MKINARNILEYALIIIAVTALWYVISLSNCNYNNNVNSNYDSIALKTVDSLKDCIIVLDDKINAMIQTSMPIRERIVYRNKFLNKNINEEFKINIDTVYMRCILYLDSMQVPNE